jgi:hypothetical protein
MNDRQTRTLKSYRRVLATIHDRGALIAPEAPVILERLTITVADITRCTLEQHIARTWHHVTGARRALEKMRTDHMMPLARLARRVFAGEPRIQAALRVPHKRAPTEVLLAAAALMVRTLRPHRALLTASHIDPKRIDRLQVETRRLKKVFEPAHAAVADRAVPSRRLPELFASARMDVRALDALLAARSQTLDALDWKRTRRVGKRIGRPRAPRQRAHAEAQSA